MEKIKKILSALNKNILEKKEPIAIALLAALSGQNIFLLGPPGTAKSLISRRLSSAFETKNYFEYLMQRFSTPEEVFGPISLTELKKDNYTRKTEGYLPKADFAFLDEIWKSSPAVLNTLLTIINEKTFRNGTTIENVPLKILISASNETPPEGQGLEALYDRFLVRLMVSPVESKEKFKLIINNQPAKQDISITEKITNDEFKKWQLGIDKIKLSDETHHVIHAIRLEIEKVNRKNKTHKIYISDRRWQRAARFIKAAAFFCDRDKTNLVDTLLLRHCLWTNDSDREKIMKIIEDAVRKNGLKTEFSSFSELETKKNKLEKEIQKEFYNSKDIYKTVRLKGKEFLEDSVTYSEYSEYDVESRPDVYSQSTDYYIPLDKMKTKGMFHPVDSQVNELKNFNCDFKGQSTYTFKVRENKIYLEHLKAGERMCESIRCKPQIEFEKGTIKQEINERLFDSLKKSVKDFSDDIKITIIDIKEKKEELERQLDSPFVPERLRAIAIESVDAQLKNISVIETDCDLLNDKIKKAEDAQ